MKQGKMETVLGECGYKCSFNVNAEISVTMATCY